MYHQFVIDLTTIYLGGLCRSPPPWPNIGRAIQFCFVSQFYKKPKIHFDENLPTVKSMLRSTKSRSHLKNETYSSCPHIERKFVSSDFCLLLVKLINQT